MKRCLRINSKGMIRKAELRRIYVLVPYCFKYCAKIPSPSAKCYTIHLALVVLLAIFTIRIMGSLEIGA